MVDNSLGDELRVNYATVTQLADEIKRGREMVERQINDLWDEVQKVDNAWKGEAREMFNVAKAEWERRAQSIKTTLTSVESKVRLGSEDYQATDRKAASGFQNF